MTTWPPFPRDPRLRVAYFTAGRILAASAAAFFSPLAVVASVFCLADLRVFFGLLSPITRTIFPRYLSVLSLPLM